MQLISTQDIVKAVNLNKFGNDNMARMIMSVLQIDKVNQLYASHYLKQHDDFLNAIIEETGITYDISDADLKRIPKIGPFVIVANHPFGGIEGLILLDSILKIRPDFKLMANFLFKRIEPIKDFVIPVNPFETHQHIASSLNGLRHGLDHLKAGSPLGIFPAGEVSAYQKESMKITDRTWSVSILKFIKNANVPVIPIHFQGKNSHVFYMMGMIHPLLRTVKLPSEMLNKKKTRIKYSIGNSISCLEQNEYKDIVLYGQYLRSKTYELGNQYEQTERFKPSVKKLISLYKIGDKISLTHEISKISDKYLLFKWQEYCVFCVPSKAIPNIIKEIGRLREITFREVGEGTNKFFDLDNFDHYYDQLFVWNAVEHEIIGGYRLGKGFEILPELGIKGFYTNTLFRLSSKMETILSQSVELGRSFIIKKYQRKPWSLFLLWKGIFNFLQQNKQCRYLLGPVSISNNYNRISKQIMIRFIEKHYFNDTIAERVTSRNPYMYEYENEIDVFLNKAVDLNSLDRIIRQTENNGLRMPVLLKKYLQMGGEIVGFNLDPKFNDCLDCLLILDLKKISSGFIDSLAVEKPENGSMKKFN